MSFESTIPYTYTIRDIIKFTYVTRITDYQLLLLYNGYIPILKNYLIN